MKFSKWHGLGAGAVAVILIGFSLYRQSRPDPPADEAIRYKEYTVARGTFKNTVSASGVVMPIDRVVVKSKASGLIVEMSVEEGDRVQVGDLICRLDQTDIRSQVDQAQADLDIAVAELKQAQNNYDRQKQLYEKGLLSDEGRDQAELSLAQAKGNMVRARTSLDQANTRLSETIVRAPSDGVILKKYVDVGQIIASGISNYSGGTAIVDLADMKSVYLEAGIDEIDVGKIQLGQMAQVMTDAYPEKPFTGAIIRLTPEARVEQNVTLFDVVIEVDNPEGWLKSGMNATVEITITLQEDVLLAPTPALQETKKDATGSSQREVLLKKGNQFVPQTIKIGASDFTTTVVLAGLQEGDVIGVPMTSRLKEENNRMEERFKSTRSFGTQKSSTTETRRP